MTNATTWDDIDRVPNRQPAYCPYCGESPAFGGLGEYGSGYRVHCPDCGFEFVIFSPNRDELDDENQTVYVKRSSKAKKDVYHDGPQSCQNARRVDSWEETTKAAAESRGLRRCGHCSDETNADASDHSHLNALKAEAQADD